VLTVVAEIEAFSPAAAHWNSFREGCQKTVWQALRDTGAFPALRQPGDVAVCVRMVSGRHERKVMADAGPGLAHVGSVVAVSSGKGGVGKSTVAVNLAYALAARGARVGILDADVHGPSLPTMVQPADTAVRKQADGCINALVLGGVRLMSYGWVAPRNARGERTGGAMRGPLTSSVVQQLLKFTAWGELDHLVIDMPPGTGDVHVTLGQSAPIATAVIVTTPQKLALADVSKGLDLFHTLKVPSAAVVLNMAHYVAPDTGRRYHPFGDARAPRRLPQAIRDAIVAGAPLPARDASAPTTEPLSDSADESAAPLQRLLEAHGISSLYELPMDEGLSVAGDSGVPFVCAFPDAPLSAVYDRLAGEVADAAERNAMAADAMAAAAASTARARPQAARAGETGGGHSTAPVPADADDDSDNADPSFSGLLSAAEASAAPEAPTQVAAPTSFAIRYRRVRNDFAVRLYSAAGANEVVIPPAMVRAACKCAACVDEASGVVKVRPERIAAGIRPTKLAGQGSYAIAIEWSDGHKTGIYTFEQLAGIAARVGVGHAAAGGAAGVVGGAAA
jgi:Mrp family chromosome partitioning ATPase/DUF971 family protein